MANKLNKTQTRGLFDFLGSHHMTNFLHHWVNASEKFMKLKIDHTTFKTMRREKLVPKVLGKSVSKGSEMEPYSLREDQAVRQLIKDTASHKEAAHIRATETWDTLKNAANAHLTTRPGILKELQSYCNGRVAKVKAEHQRKADHNLKTQIAKSKWERMARPGVVIDMSGNRINKTEKKTCPSVLNSQLDSITKHRWMWPRP